MSDTPPKQPFPWPKMHYMSLATIDLWVRVLFKPFAIIKPKYLPRLIVNLLISIFATLLTLPERIFWAIWVRIRKVKPTELPGPVFVLGYYRSGTTHLHYILNCDPNFFTPKWDHALLPQGWVFSWAVIRMILIPFLAGSRPMDGVGMGPEFPSEDQFGVANHSGACALIGRSVFPQQAKYYNQFHSLDDLADHELERWKQSQWWFIRKLASVAHGKRILLKSPCHTAHADRLWEILDQHPDAKFIHICRDPQKVIRSNSTMFGLFQEIWNLQDPVPILELDQALAHEYVESEKRYLEFRDQIPDGQLSEIRLQDLNSDPLSEIKRVYQELNLEYSEALEKNIIQYFQNTADYKSGSHSQWSDEQDEAVAPVIAPLYDLFDHKTDPIPKVPIPEATKGNSFPQMLRTGIAMIAAVVLSCLSGTGWAWLCINDMATSSAWNRLIWPISLLISFSALAIAKEGSQMLSVMLTSLVMCVFVSVTWLSGAAASTDPVSYSVNQWLFSLMSFPTILWLVISLFTALRVGSYKKIL